MKRRSKLAGEPWKSAVEHTFIISVDQVESRYVVISSPRKRDTPRISMLYVGDCAVTVPRNTVWMMKWHAYTAQDLGTWYLLREVAHG